MKKLVALALIAALVGLGGTTAQAAKVWDDMSWWGNTGATPEPVKDPKGRSGYWWWPKEPASNAGDTELWGNRGVVYYTGWKKPAPPEKAEVKTPKPEEPPKATRSVIMMNNVLFDFDKAVLKPEGKKEVDRLVAELKKHPGDTVVVGGHTCNVGDAAYNMGLGQRRADAVKAHMVMSGIAASRITAKSHGEMMPAVSNDTAASRKNNRRAEFSITMGK